MTSSLSRVVRTESVNNFSEFFGATPPFVRGSAVGYWTYEQYSDGIDGSWRTTRGGFLEPKVHRAGLPGVVECGAEG